MKHLKTINELLTAKHNERTKGKTKYHVAWNNGNIIYNPEQMEVLRINPTNPMSRALIFTVDKRKKTVTILPMDDWADTKIILKVQNAFKDMIKAGDIDSTWHANIGNEENTRRSIGGTDVATILKYDAQWQKTIPFAFHGTTDKYLETIKKNGIVPRTMSKVDKNWRDFYTEDSINQVYLTIDFDRAAYYAEKAVDSSGGNPIVIEIRDLPVKDLVADDDFKNNAGMMMLLMAMSGGDVKDTYHRSIRNSGQFALKGGVPPEMIHEVHKI